MIEKINDNVNKHPDARAKGEGETSKLLPCPMCNGKASVVEPVTGRIWRFYIRCKDCGTRTENLKSKDYAIAAWNRRFDAALTASREECERLKKTNKAANFCEAHIPDPELPYLICPICLTGQLSDSMDKCEQLRKENETLKEHIDFRGENKDSPWSDEARQAVYELEEKFDIEVVSIGHHVKFFDEIERLSAEVAGLRAQLTAALAERDKARAEVLEEAAKAICEGCKRKWNLVEGSHFQIPGQKCGIQFPCQALAIRALSGATGEKAEK